jgi:hypothetical protein
MKVGLWFIFIAGLVASDAASAQHELVLQRLNQENAEHPTLSETDAQKAVLDKFREISLSKGECVPTGVKIEAPIAITGDPFFFGMVLSGNVKNVWRVYAVFEGCGSNSVQRFAVLDAADNNRVAVFVNQGRSITSLKIMQDTAPMAGIQAAVGARKRQPECNGTDMELISTQVVNEGEGLGPEVYGTRYTGSWTESWRFKTCGMSFDVPILFTADGDGGAYTNIKGDAVREVVVQP